MWQLFICLMEKAPNPRILFREWIKMTTIRSVDWHESVKKVGKAKVGRKLVVQAEISSDENHRWNERRRNCEFMHSCLVSFVCLGTRMHGDASFFPLFALFLPLPLKKKLTCRGWNLRGTERLNCDDFFERLDFFVRAWYIALQFPFNRVFFCHDPNV